jgi:hypothetical protein
VENDVMVVVGAAIQYHKQGEHILGLNLKTELPGLDYRHPSGNCCEGNRGGRWSVGKEMMVVVGVAI